MVEEAAAAGPISTLHQQAATAAANENSASILDTMELNSDTGHHGDLEADDVSTSEEESTWKVVE
jgi:hypothetical protein